MTAYAWHDSQSRQERARWRTALGLLHRDAKGVV
jgi:hypothetical protein